MIRVHYRTGRRSGISMPLWLAVIGYMFWAAAVAVVAAVVGLALATAVVLYLLGMLVQLVAVRVRRRRAQ